MRARFATFTMAAVIAAALALVVTTATAQTPAYRAPRTADGKPNLNGIWQALTTAYWDIEAHPAGPSVVRELGAADDVLGQRRGGDVDLAHRQSEQRVAHRATNHAGFLAVRVQQPEHARCGA